MLSACQTAPLAGHPQGEADRVAPGQFARQELERVTEAVDGDDLAEQFGGGHLALPDQLDRGLDVVAGEPRVQVQLDRKSVV